MVIVKKILKLCVLTAAVFVCMFAFIQNANAENIRVGLHFGDDAVYSFTAQSPAGFEVGYARDSVFYKLAEISGASSVYAEQGGGHYLISAVSYNTLEEAINAASAMRALDVFAHSGYVDGKFYVLNGLYDSEEQAKSYIESLKQLTAMDFSYVYMDTKTVYATMGDCGFVFRNESDAFCVSARLGGTISVGGKGEYRGAIMADRTYSKAVSVINLVDIDDYLASVVGSEMYPTWHIEALKAQAVIARTYALTRTGYKGYGIDVTDDTRTQAYKGVSQETESTYRAAHETSGMVVKYNGKLAETYFYSMSGGKTADVYSAWGGGAGLDYLKSVDDIYEDVENIKSDIWQVTYTPDEIEAKLSAAGVNIGEVRGATVAERGDDLRVRKLVITGTEGEYTLTFDRCRSFFNLRSQYYYVSGGGANEVNSASVISGSGISSVNLSGAMVLSASGISKAPDNLYVSGAGASTVLMAASSSGEDISFVFDGRGNGHGVGLSQYGAYGMAKAGFTYTDIIKFYFTGVTVERYN